MPARPPSYFFVNIQNSKDNEGDIRKRKTKQTKKRKKKKEKKSPPHPRKEKKKEGKAPPSPSHKNTHKGRRKKVNTTDKQNKETRLADVELTQRIWVGNYRESQQISTSWLRQKLPSECSLPCGKPRRQPTVWALLYECTENHLGMDSAFSVKW